ARVGDTLQIGYARFEIRASLTNIPGDPGIAATIGPRVFIPDRYLAETGLITAGARAEWEAVIKLPEEVKAPIWIAPLRPQFERQNIRVRTVEEREIDLTDAIQQLARFLSVVGLIALLLG